LLTVLEHILYRALPIGLRVSGLMSFSPFLGSLSIPIRIKAAFTLVLTALLYPICAVPQTAVNLSGWTRLVLGELTLGLALGLCMQFVIEGAVLAGQLAGFQLAFSLVNIIDPQTNVDTPVLSTFYQLFALILFLQMNVHHWLLRGLAKSFEYVPVGSIAITAPAMKELFRATRGMWLLGVEIAAPILVATILLDLAVGLLSKASPQMPAVFLGIPIKNLVGYAVLAIGVGFWPGIFEEQFSLALGWSEHVLRLAH